MRVDESERAPRPAPAGPVTVTPYRDGPYLLRGAFLLLDEEGNEIPPRRRIVALCRCGRSSVRPFCDGTHRAVGFVAPGGPAARTASGTSREPAP